MDKPATTPGPCGDPTLHLHPLRRCNLACAHCYSSSSPGASDYLDPAVAKEAIRQAARWGYRRLAISGGEPLLYRWLGELIDVAATVGMSSAVVTNGLLATRRGNLDILKRCDTVAVSIDGMHATHDALRGHPGALDKVLKALHSMGGAGIAVSVVCGVSRLNANEVEQVAHMAFEHGVAELQLHVISRSGRARDGMASCLLDERGTQELYLAARLLAALYDGGMQVRVDLVHRNVVAAIPALVYALEVEHASGRAPADVLGVLVVEPDGQVNPVCFGFGPLYGLGRIGAGGLAPLWSQWVRHRYPSLTALGQRLWHQALRQEGALLVNPNDLLNQASQHGQLLLRQKPALV